MPIAILVVLAESTTPSYSKDHSHRPPALCQDRSSPSAEKWSRKEREEVMSAMAIFGFSVFVQIQGASAERGFRTPHRLPHPETDSSRPPVLLASMNIHRKSPRQARSRKAIKPTSTLHHQQGQQPGEASFRGCERVQARAGG